FRLLGRRFLGRGFVGRGLVGGRLVRRRFVRGGGLVGRRFLGRGRRQRRRVVGQRPEIGDQVGFFLDVADAGEGHRSAGDVGARRLQEAAQVLVVPHHRAALRELAHRRRIV